jgi:hypothetical protein
MMQDNVQVSKSQNSLLYRYILLIESEFDDRKVQGRTESLFQEMLT